MISFVVCRNYVTFASIKISSPNKLEQYSQNIAADYDSGDLSWKAIAKDLNIKYKK